MDLPLHWRIGPSSILEKQQCLAPKLLSDSRDHDVCVIDAEDERSHLTLLKQLYKIIETQCHHFNCFALTLICSFRAIVEAATTIINASAISIMLVDGCRLAAADVALLLLLTPHLEDINELKEVKNEESPNIGRSSYYDGKSKQKAYFFNEMSVNVEHEK